MKIDSTGARSRWYGTKSLKGWRRVIISSCRRPVSERQQGLGDVILKISEYSGRAATLIALAAGVAGLLPAHAETTRPSLTAQPACEAPAEMTRLDHALQRTGQRLAAYQPLTIVAIGSSSTAGAGASSPAASYPSRLAVELRERFPGRAIAVHNKGVNGEDAREMLARFDSNVMSEKPDLVLWQVGTNSLLGDRPLSPAGMLIRSGLKRLKAAGADIVLINPQYAPKVIAKPDIADLVALLAEIAKLENVNMFHRFETMRYWRDVAGIPNQAFLSPDELHMNDWSYACVAKLLAGVIADAATRPVLSAGVGRPRP
jgi:lysophospholipase L1-like esterase